MFGLSWIGDAFKDLINSITEVIKEVSSYIGNVSSSATMINDAVTVFIPSVLQIGCITCILIAVFYKIFGREG
jgi:hypothetical protein